VAFCVRLGNFFNSKSTQNCRKILMHLLQGSYSDSDDMPPTRPCPLPKKNSECRLTILLKKILGFSEYLDGNLPYKGIRPHYWSLCYIFVFAILYLYWKTDEKEKLVPFWCILVLLWTVRSLWKRTRRVKAAFWGLPWVITLRPVSWAIPFILLGFYYILRPKPGTSRNRTNTLITDPKLRSLHNEK